MEESESAELVLAEAPAGFDVEIEFYLINSEDKIFQLETDQVWGGNIWSDWFIYLD